MNGRQVHSVVAAGLKDPGLLESWAEDTGVLTRLGVAPDTLALATLRKFAGLTAMVRHNGLREDLPRSFRLLSQAALEIDLFADYAVHLARATRPLAPGTAARAAALAAFVGGWIDPAQSAHRSLHDMLRHEAAILSLGGDVTLPPPPERAFARVSADAVPRVRGAIILHEFHGDPRRAEAEAGAGSPGATLGYWRGSATAPLHILDLDICAYEMLRRIDGVASATELARAVTGAAPGPTFLAALDELAALRVIVFVAP